MQPRILLDRSILFLVVVGIFCAAYFGAQPLHAQIGLPQGGITIIPNPSFPEPGSEVTLSLDDYSVRAIGSDISWYIDGVEVPGSRNERSITIPAGNLGESKMVSIQLAHGGITLSANHTIRPIDVSIVLEADTYVPKFYRGRALPSSNAQMRAVAIVNDGKGISWDKYSYKWTLGETVLFGGPVKGKYAVDINAPTFSGSLLSVEIYNASSDIIGGRAVEIELAEPHLLFYEYSPLRGLSGRAAGETYSVVGVESAIYAEPFFLNTISLFAQNTLFEWKLDGRRVGGNMSAPNAIMLRTTGEGGRAKVSATALTTQQIPQYAQDSFTVLFE